ncbi:MAG: HlyC/CorC family transporter [Acidobacteria bacterium]|nr:HlyC/CorC family transporter [Acidobacteriota bacterium]
MIPYTLVVESFALFLLACVLAYLGTVDAAFTALMRLPLRLSAERGRALERLGYLDDPARLFVPVRLLQVLTVSLAAGVSLLVAGGDGLVSAGIVAGALAVAAVVCGQLVPLLLVRRDPEGVLVLLLPSFERAVRPVRPLSEALVGLLQGIGYRSEAVDGNGAPGSAGGEEPPAAGRAAAEEQDERELLQSVVEFGDTLVREVMTPRPDIVAVRSTATLDELRARFAEERYSRLPVYQDSLDTILGFVVVRDLVGLTDASGSERIVERLLRPAHTVPETKRVAELLKELQAERVQSAIVHDEYGGTAGLVTIEDLLEEIVGEIRDEYDREEDEPIIDEGDGTFLFAGGVSVDDMSRPLDAAIEPQGFETVAGYVLSRLGRVPHAGETFDADGLCIEVVEAERRRVRRVRIRRGGAAPEAK